jgi:hypothetical protein
MSELATLSLDRRMRSGAGGARKDRLAQRGREGSVSASESGGKSKEGSAGASRTVGTGGVDGDAAFSVASSGKCTSDEVATALAKNV